MRHEREIRLARPRSKNIWKKASENVFYTDLKHGRIFISKESLSKVENFKWFTKKSKNGSFYVYSHASGNKKFIIHRLIMNVDDQNILVDHVNGDTLDNRIENLRLATKLQNNVNSKKRKNSKTLYKGVTIRPSGRFGCYINNKGKSVCLGTFDTQEEAGLAYNKMAKKLFGEFAKLNEIGENNG